MVEAGNDQGRAATSHLLKADGPGASVMAHVYHNGDTQLNTLHSKNGGIDRSRRVTWFSQGGLAAPTRIIK
jgi:hypothetical protein